MSSELRVMLREPTGAMSAERVLTGLSQMLRLIGELEDAVRHQDSRPQDRSVWALAHLAVGSVEAGYAPLELRRGATWEDLDRVAQRAVQGFAEAEAQESVPAGWTPEAAIPAAGLAKGLGATVDAGMRLTLISGGKAVQEVDVTRRAARNLHAALKVRRESIGSVTGTVGSITVHGRNRAGLWADRDDARVLVTFTDEQTPMIREALGDRVLVRGRLRRNSNGQLIGVTMRDLEPLSSAEAAPLGSLTGLAPDLTGGQTTREYLQDISWHVLKIRRPSTSTRQRSFLRLSPSLAMSR